MTATINGMLNRPTIVAIDIMRYNAISSPVISDIPAANSNTENAPSSYRILIKRDNRNTLKRILRPESHVLLNAFISFLLSVNVKAYREVSEGRANGIDSADWIGLIL